MSTREQIPEPSRESLLENALRWLIEAVEREHIPQLGESGQPTSGKVIHSPNVQNAVAHALTLLPKPPEFIDRADRRRVMPR